MQQLHTIRMVDLFVAELGENMTEKALDAFVRSLDTPDDVIAESIALEHNLTEPFSVNPEQAQRDREYMRDFLRNIGIYDDGFKLKDEYKDDNA